MTETESRSGMNTHVQAPFQHPWAITTSDLASVHEPSSQCLWTRKGNTPKYCREERTGMKSTGKEGGRRERRGEGRRGEGRRREETRGRNSFS